MTIHIHDPDQDEQRANAKPLTKQEEDAAVNFINELIAYHQDPDPEMGELLQRLIHNYEKLVKSQREE